MTSKAKRAQYMLEFKLEAVRLVKAGQSQVGLSRTPCRLVHVVTG